VAGGH